MSQDLLGKTEIENPYWRAHRTNPSFSNATFIALSHARTKNFEVGHPEWWIKNIHARILYSDSKLVGRRQNSCAISTRGGRPKNRVTFGRKKISNMGAIRFTHGSKNTRIVAKKKHANFCKTNNHVDMVTWAAFPDGRISIVRDAKYLFPFWRRHASKIFGLVSWLVRFG